MNSRAWILVVLAAGACRRGDDAAGKDAFPLPPQLAPTPARAERALRAMPLYFEPNQGQAAAEVAFLSGGPGYQVHLSSREARLALRQGGQTLAGERSSVFSLSLVGAREVRGVGEQRLRSQSHYFFGRAGERAVSSIPHPVLFT